MKINKTIIRLICLLAIGVMSVGCSKAEDTKNVLMVSAAASLSNCMSEMEQAFEIAYPNIDVQFNFGGSGTLEQQILQGAPVDVFFSAGTKQMNNLIVSEMIQKESQKNVLENKLVLVTSLNTPSIDSFQTLGASYIGKIGVGEPGSVPVGQYTQQVFESLGMSQQVQSKLVYGKDVREVLSWVETGHVEVGIVYETDAKQSDLVKVDCIAEEAWHKPIIYPVGMVRGTPHEEAAKSFMNFLDTEKAKDIFESYGFTHLGSF